MYEIIAKWIEVLRISDFQAMKLIRDFSVQVFGFAVTPYRKLHQQSSKFWVSIKYTFKIKCMCIGDFSSHGQRYFSETFVHVYRHPVTVNAFMCAMLNVHYRDTDGQLNNQNKTYGDTFCVAEFGCLDGKASLQLLFCIIGTSWIEVTLAIHIVCIYQSEFHTILVYV